MPPLINTGTCRRQRGVAWRPLWNGAALSLINGGRLACY